MDDFPAWRKTLFQSLQERKRRDEVPFKDIIRQNNRLLNHVAELEANNLKLSVENEQLRKAFSTGGGTNGKDSTATQLAIAALEKKLLTQQEELTDLHKRKGQNAQLIVDLNIKMEKQLQLIDEKQQSLAEKQTANTSLKAEVLMLTTSLEQLKDLNTTLRDEYTALQLAFSAMEEKLRSVQDENRSLVDRFMRYKSKDADKLNEENDNFLRKRLPSIFRKRSDKIKRDLEDAVREIDSPLTQHHCNSSSHSFQGAGGGDHNDDDDRDANTVDHCAEAVSDDMYLPPLELYSAAGSSILGGFGFYKSACPTKIHMEFEVHETESHAVRWSPIARIIATGGADRRVKLWDVGKRCLEPIGVLGGSSAGINSVDFDSTGCYVIGTSNDYGARIWTTADSRLRVWADFKVHTKQKLRRNKTDIGGTDGGPSRYNPLSPLEEQVVKLLNMTDSVKGLPGALCFGATTASNLENNGEDMAVMEQLDEVPLQELATEIIVDSKVATNVRSQSCERNPRKRSRSVSLCDRDSLLKKQVENQIAYQKECMASLKQINENMKSSSRYQRKDFEIREKELGLARQKFEFEKENAIENKCAETKT